MKKQYTNPVITIEELLKQDVLLMSVTNPINSTVEEGPIGNAGTDHLDLG